MVSPIHHTGVESRGVKDKEEGLTDRLNIGEGAECDNSEAALDSIPGIDPSLESVQVKLWLAVRWGSKKGGSPTCKVAECAARDGYPGACRVGQCLPIDIDDSAVERTCGGFG